MADLAHSVVRQRLILESTRQGVTLNGCGLVFELDGSPLAVAELADQIGVVRARNLAADIAYDVRRPVSVDVQRNKGRIEIQFHGVAVPVDAPQWSVY